MMTNLNNIIQAICALDIDAIEKWMDDDVLHFEAKKNVALKYLKEFLEWISKEKGESVIKIKKIKCNTCYHDGDIEVIHEHAILFELPAGRFAFDIKPTVNGLYSLDQCSPSQDENIHDQSLLMIYAFLIPYDLLHAFKPDNKYLDLLTEKEILLSEIDNGKVIYWFIEDFSAWIDKHDGAIKALNELRPHSFVLGPLQEILAKMNYLYDGLKAEKICQAANEEYDKLNHADIWEEYEWMHRYQRRQYSYIDPSELNLTHVEDGYFTFKDFLPNLRFSIYGHQAFLKFIHNLSMVYNRTEEIRNERLLNDIEDEWFWEEGNIFGSADESDSNNYED